MTFNEHKVNCEGCKNFNFCAEGLALLNTKNVVVFDSITEEAEKLGQQIAGETVEKPFTQDEVEEGIKEIEKELNGESTYVEVDDHKVVKVKTEADRFLTKKQRWRKYKNQIKKDPNKVGLTKFHRN